MSGHTEGRLQLYSRNDTIQIDPANKMAGGNSAVVHWGGFDAASGGLDEKRANARRLVACWNACEGIPTEQLDRDPQITIGQMLIVAVSTRDELIEALRELLEAEAAIFPPFEDGAKAQEEWAERKLLAEHAAETLLARLSPKERK